MKREFRERFRGVLGAMSAEEMQAKSNAAAQRLLASREYQQSQVIMVFISLPSEIDTTPIALHAWQDHKRVLAPKVSWAQRRMLAVEIRSLTEDLIETQFGVHEPIAGVPVPISTIDLVIVPGLGFDEFGNRLGRGRGFYDRFLSNPEFQGVSCGLAFDEQVTHTVPTGPHDRAVDLLVTDCRVVHFDKPEL